MVASKKDRVYIAIYARGGLDPNAYHWAIIVGPKNEVEHGRGIRYRVRQRLDPARPGHHIWHNEALDPVNTDQHAVAANNYRQNSE